MFQSHNAHIRFCLQDGINSMLHLCFHDNSHCLYSFSLFSHYHHHDACMGHMGISSQWMVSLHWCKMNGFPHLVFLKIQTGNLHNYMSCHYRKFHNPCNKGEEQDPSSQCNQHQMKQYSQMNNLPLNLICRFWICMKRDLTYFQ